MQLTMWTYEGPPHVGAMRIAASMRDLHYVLHAPQGDTYADLLFTMIERRKSRPPVTYTTFQARDLGGDTAEIFKSACHQAVAHFDPKAIIVGASCTAELLQDDPSGLAKTLGLDIPVVPLELPSYQKKENWGAAETFFQLVRGFAGGRTPAVGSADGPKSCNILGPTALGFRNRDDIVEVVRLVEALGVDVNIVAPLHATPYDLTLLPNADFNIVLYPEIAGQAAHWLKRTYKQPIIDIQPIGVGATKEFICAVAEQAGVDPQAVLASEDERLSWYSRSIDSNYLTGKRVFIFGDATHAIAAARIAEKELGFKVCGLGTYAREFARDVRAAAEQYGVEALITDDHLEVEDAIVAAQPELVLGTQMERHVAKRLRIPCAVISSPVHVQDFPARYSPQMGFEGANVIFDSWVHPLMMGLEEHLLQMFRDDFEFNDDAQASHLAAVHANENHPQVATSRDTNSNVLAWTQDAEKELKKIPFFVRGKARRNTESFAAERGFNPITVETLYDAKAHYAR
ncbi:MAG: ferredoxin:protochlorophyllide reductase (ATP-dependent) subunit B [Pseudomonadota bacterium]